MLKDVLEQLPEHVGKAGENLGEEFGVDLELEVSNIVPLEPHFDEDDAMAFSMYANVGANIGGERESSTIACTATFVNASGSVLFLYAYAPKPELEWTRRASREWADSVLASNDAAPATGGFDWNSIWGKAAIGAIVGAAAGLLMMIFKRREA